MMMGMRSTCQLRRGQGSSSRRSRWRLHRRRLRRRTGSAMVYAPLICKSLCNLSMHVICLFLFHQHMHGSQCMISFSTCTLFLSNQHMHDMVHACCPCMFEHGCSSRLLVCTCMRQPRGSVAFAPSMQMIEGTKRLLIMLLTTLFPQLRMTCSVACVWNHW